MRCKCVKIICLGYVDCTKVCRLYRNHCYTNGGRGKVIGFKRNTSYLQSTLYGIAQELYHVAADLLDVIHPSPIALLCSHSLSAAPEGFIVIRLSLSVSACACACVCSCPNCCPIVHQSFFLFSTFTSLSVWIARLVRSVRLTETIYQSKLSSQLRMCLNTSKRNRCLPSQSKTSPHPPKSSIASSSAAIGPAKTPVPSWSSVSYSSSAWVSRFSLFIDS